MTLPAAPLRVLCVDDEIHVLSLVADTLRTDGHDVETALDGAHALQKIATTDPPFHLLIVDSRMPHLDGWGLIMQARNNGFKGKVIVFSAWLDAHERQRYGRLEIDRVLEKPPRSGELIEAVRKIAVEVSGSDTIRDEMESHALTRPESLL